MRHSCGASFLNILAQSGGWIAKWPFTNMFNEESLSDSLFAAQARPDAPCGALRSQVQRVSLPRQSIVKCICGRLLIRERNSGTQIDRSVRDPVRPASKSRRQLIGPGQLRSLRPTMIATSYSLIIRGVQRQRGQSSGEGRNCKCSPDQEGPAVRAQREPPTCGPTVRTALAERGRRPFAAETLLDAGRPVIGAA